MLVNSSCNPLAIEVDEEDAPWAAAGSNATLYLQNIDPIHLSQGFVLCPPSSLVPLSTVFTAHVIVFDIDVPLTVGVSVELFHHSHNVPATLSTFVATLDRATGKVVKKSPRVLQKGVSAEVKVTLRAVGMAGPNARVQPVPIEPFAANKDMGRLLLRRNGETVAAGVSDSCFYYFSSGADSIQGIVLDVDPK